MTWKKLDLSRNRGHKRKFTKVKLLKETRFALKYAALYIDYIELKALEKIDV